MEELYSKYYILRTYFSHISVIFLSNGMLLYTIGKPLLMPIQWYQSHIPIIRNTKVIFKILHFLHLLRFLSLRRNVTYLGSPKLGRLYRYVKSLPTFCFPHISSSTSSSTYFATSLYHTKFALSNGAKSLICYIGK